MVLLLDGSIAKCGVLLEDKSALHFQVASRAPWRILTARLLRKVKDAVGWAGGKLFRGSQGGQAADGKPQWESEELGDLADLVPKHWKDHLGNLKSRADRKKLKKYAMDCIMWPSYSGGSMKQSCPDLSNTMIPQEMLVGLSLLFFSKGASPSCIEVELTSPFYLPLHELCPRFAL